MHLEHDLLETVTGRLVVVEHLDAPALTLRIARVHAEQISTEQRRLITAGAGANLDDDVAVVIGIGGEQNRAQVLVLVVRCRELCLVLLLRHGHHLRIRFRMGHFRRLARRALRLAPATRGLDNLAQFRLLTRQLLHAVKVLVCVGCAQQRLELDISRFEGGEALLERCQLRLRLRHQRAPVIS